MLKEEPPNWSGWAEMTAAEREKYLVIHASDNSHRWLTPLVGRRFFLDE